MPRTKRRRLRWLLPVGFLVALIAWAAAALLTLSDARTEVKAGRARLDAVRAAISDPADIADGTGLDDLRAARTHLEAATRATGGALLAPARFLPIVGRQIVSAHALSAAALTVVEAGIDGITDARAALDLPKRSGEQRVALLRRFAAIAARAHDRVDGLDLGPSDHLVGALADARAELSTQITELRDGLGRGAAAASATADLLEGPRRLLLVAANNAEMRAGSGMFLSVASVRLRDGSIDLGPMTAVPFVEPPPGAVRVTGDYRARWGWLSPGDEWRNLMLSPRFDVSAPLAASMWEAAGKPRVDGVIAIDPAGLKAILEATGPVRADGRRIGPGDILEELLYQQYVRFSADPTSVRREALGEIARAAMNALNRGGWDAPVLVSRLADAARGRHVMLWSDRPAEQHAWHAAGVDGAVGVDSMLVGIMNRGGNKLDRFLRVRARLTLEPSATGTDGLLTVTIRNTTPPGQPAYVAGPNPAHGSAEGEYLGFLSVTLPGASGSATIRGGSRIVAVGADGPTRVVAAEFGVARGRTKTLRVRFAFAAAAGQIRIEPSARIPAIDWTYDDLSWTDRVARTIRW